MGGDQIWDVGQRPPRHRPRRDHRRRPDHPRADRVQRGVRLRAGRDGQLGVLRQPDARVAPTSWSTTCAPAGRSRRPAAPARVCDFKQVSRVLAGFPDGRADEGVGAGPASLVGLRLAHERGWAAPASQEAAPTAPTPAAAEPTPRAAAPTPRRAPSGTGGRQPGATPPRTAPRTTPTRRLRAGRARHEHPADPDPHQVLGRPAVLDAGDLRAARRLPGAAQGARHAAGRPGRS